MFLPILLPLFVDDLIARLSWNGICIQGYADDICLPAVGKFPNPVSGLMQWTLHTVETWCDEVGLLVNLDKTELVVFKRRRKPPCFLKPLFWGYLHHCMSVKYLRVVLDSQPTCREHVDVTVREVHSLLWDCRRARGMTWGLSPNLVLRLYVSLIWLFTTFAS